MDWPSLFSQHERWLRTVVYARLGERDGVDDVLQEVALAVAKQTASLVDPAKVSGWLYRLAIRQVLLHRRKCGRRRKLINRFVDDARPTDFDPREPDPLDWLLADERQRLVRDALRRLPPRDAELLLLKYTENWGYQKIADQLGISHSAVEARLHRARARMRSELAALQANELETKR